MIDYRTAVIPALLFAALAPACAAPTLATDGAGPADQTADQTEAAGGAKPGAKPSATPDGGTPPPPADACPYTGPPIDVSGFKTCSDGGRCVPAGFVPEKERSRLAACPAGFCVAEKIIKAKGQLVPKTCKSLGDAEGRCESIVFPELDAQKDRLPVDVCDANERCAPCFLPGTGADTGACRSVSCDAPKTTAKPAAPCCTSGGKSRGLCVSKTLMKPAEAAQLEQKECTDAATICAPAENFDPKFVPAKCKASALLGPYDGVCISDCVKQTFFLTLGTAPGNCAAGNFCAPCKNPLTGAPSGAPGCGP